jgi:hypothetical protein
MKKINLKSAKTNSMAQLSEVILNLAAKNPIVRRLIVAGSVLALATCSSPTKPADDNGNGTTGPWDFDPCDPMALVAEAPRMAKSMAETTWAINVSLMADSAAACSRRSGVWNPQDANCVDTAGLPNPEYNEVSRGDIIWRVNRLEGVKPTTGYPKERGQYDSDSSCFADNGIADNLAYDVNYASCFRDVYSPQSETFVFARFPTVKRENLRVARKVWGAGDIDEDYAHLFHCLQANGTGGGCRLSNGVWYANIPNSPEPNPCADDNRKGVCKPNTTVSILENPRVIPPNNGRGCR